MTRSMVLPMLVFALSCRAAPAPMPVVEVVAAPPSIEPAVASVKRPRQAQAKPKPAECAESTLYPAGFEGGRPISLSRGGDTPRKRDCSELFWLSLYTRENLDKPCRILSLANDLDAIVVFNDQAHQETAGVRAQAQAYRAALVVEARALRELAKALQEGDDTRVTGARIRALRAIDAEDRVRGRFWYVCQ